MKSQNNALFTNGIPALLILQLLKAKEMYGYEIVQAIREATGEDIVLGEGVIYPALHALEREGALQSKRQTVAGRSRIYYRVTPEGGHRLASLTERWVKVTSAVKNLLGDSSYA